jgi:hypothetical protein
MLPETSSGTGNPYPTSWAATIDPNDAAHPHRAPYPGGNHRLGICRHRVGQMRRRCGLRAARQQAVDDPRREQRREEDDYGTVGPRQGEQSGKEEHRGGGRRQADDNDDPPAVSVGEPAPPRGGDIEQQA